MSKQRLMELADNYASAHAKWYAVPNERTRDVACAAQAKIDEYADAVECDVKAFVDVINEARKAHAAYGAFHSWHELESVLREEMEEFATEVRRKPGMRLGVALRAELVQVAAVALRAIEQIDNGPEIK